MTSKKPFRPRRLPQRCVQRLHDPAGDYYYPYDARPDENERLAEIALRLSRLPTVQAIVDRAGFDKDLTDDEERLIDTETIRILDEMGWEAPFFRNILSSLALARRLCAGAMAREDAAACLRFVSDRRCERYYNILRIQRRERPPPARLSDWLTSLHYFQTREDLWGPFTQARAREPGKIGNFIQDEKLERKVYGALTGFALKEQVKHALCAWREVRFSGLVGAYAERRLDRFDDEAAIAEFLDTNWGDLVDDRTETRP